MKVDKIFNTSLVWYHRNEQMPAEKRRILVFSEIYDEQDPFRVRLIDSQFFKISKDADWWAYINLPTKPSKD